MDPAELKRFIKDHDSGLYFTRQKGDRSGVLSPDGSLAWMQTGSLPPTSLGEILVAMAI